MGDMQQGNQTSSLSTGTLVTKRVYRGPQTSFLSFKINGQISPARVSENKDMATSFGERVLVQNLLGQWCSSAPLSIPLASPTDVKAELIPFPFGSYSESYLLKGSSALGFLA